MIYILVFLTIFILFVVVTLGYFLEKHIHIFFWILAFVLMIISSVGLLIYSFSFKNYSVIQPEYTIENNKITFVLADETIEKSLEEIDFVVVPTEVEEALVINVRENGKIAKFLMLPFKQGKEIQKITLRIHIQDN